MEERERNARAWADSAHWTGPRWLGLYRAPEDSRVWVPKHPKVLGWTVNLARPGGVAILLALIAGVVIFIAVALP
ncbi:hypothetical protein [Luteimonas terrae]|uniref:Membrane protein n=1 Tax=Luteimonas terrae TaxID=1530191 RepID=A0ABU1XRN9_9GAMM|nr:hypothetical protein [Luteimonas terrae]MDR7191430.1 putative membrane protein [Luteimonas terrae]